MAMMVGSNLVVGWDRNSVEIGFGVVGGMVMMLGVSHFQMIFVVMRMAVHIVEGVVSHNPG